MFKDFFVVCFIAFTAYCHAQVPVPQDASPSEESSVTINGHKIIYMQNNISLTISPDGKIFVNGKLYEASNAPQANSDAPATIPHLMINVHINGVEQ